MRRDLIILILFIGIDTFAQIGIIDNGFNSAFSNSNISSKSILNSINNPSSAAKDDKFSFGFSILDKYQLKELKSLYIFGKLNTTNGNFQASMFARGSSEDYDLISSLSYSLKTSSNSYTSLQLVYNFLSFKIEDLGRVNENFLGLALSHSHSIESTELAIILKYHHNLHDQWNSTATIFSLTHSFTKQLEAYSSIVVETSQKTNINLGLNFDYGNIQIGGGINIFQIMPSLALTFKISDYIIITSTSYDTNLGYKFSLSLAY